MSASDFTTGGGSPAETIPVSDALYDINGLTTATGPATFGFVPQVDLSQNPQDVVSATSVDGNTSVTWNPVVQITVPGGAVGRELLRHHRPLRVLSATAIVTVRGQIRGRRPPTRDCAGGVLSAGYHRPTSIARSHDENWPRIATHVADVRKKPN